MVFESMDLCLFADAGDVAEFDPELASEIQFKLLDSEFDYIQKRDGDIISRQPFIFNGNPYHYKNVSACN